jgi:16S rRNA (guanine527-N7)-methyltransferase
VRIAPHQAVLLGQFEQLLLLKAVPLGLVAASDAQRIRTRHVLDCLRAVLAIGDRVKDAYDLGSGAGLPGLVLAVALPDLHVGLVEPRRRKVAFLELAVECLGLANVDVLSVRAEDLEEPVDLCLARAFAPATRAWRVASRVLRPGGALVYFAGEQFDPAEVPPGTVSRMVAASLLESTGPLVIMTEQ